MRIWSKKVVLIFPVVIFIVFYLEMMNFAQPKMTGKPSKKVMYAPIRLDFGAGGDLLVSDYRQGKVLTVDAKTGKVLRSFAVDGRPMGVAYLKGRIYVGNVDAGRIDVFNVAGKKFKKKGSFKTPVGNPTDIAVDPEIKRIFVVDGSAKHVKVFDPKGNLLAQIPASDPDHSLLAAPTGIAVDPVLQEVLVSDYGDREQDISPRVQIFDYSGNYQETIAGVTEGGGMGGIFTKPRFSRPQGLAVDGAGHVFLVDCYSCEILVFDRLSGDLLKTLGGYGLDPGQLRLPLDIVFQAKTKDLFLTNNRDARIEIFKKGGVL